MHTDVIITIIIITQRKRLMLSGHLIVVNGRSAVSHGALETPHVNTVYPNQLTAVRTKARDSEYFYIPPTAYRFSV